MMKLKSGIVAALTIAAFSICAPAAPSATPTPSPAASPTTHPAGTKGHRRTAEKKASHITAGQRELGAKMVEAINEKSLTDYRKLVSPTALKCFNKSNQLYFDQWMSRQLSYPIEGKFDLSIIDLEIAHRHPGRFLNYRLEPSHMLSFSFTDGGAQITLNRPIVQENGKWYADIPCPTALEMKRLTELEKKRVAAVKRAQKLYPKLNEPLKSQLLDLAQKGNEPGAWKLCAKSMHTDLFTARELVSILTADSSDKDAPASTAGPKPTSSHQN
ncbi:MAG TPA: hypothetical protein VMT58_01400 [Candidatus Binataceae bacterium]|nr:hypothetical protein [Candidatus Binataceae bacterium]